MLRWLVLLVVFLASPVFAADTPPMPAPLVAQQSRGAQVYYLGKYETLDGWVLIRAGQPEFYYATEDGKAIIMGLLFNGSGDLLTVNQFHALDTDQQTGIANMMSSQIQTEFPNATAPSTAPAQAGPAATPAPTPAPAQATGDTLVPNTPGNQLFLAAQSSNNLLYGQENVPAFYAFIDPNCPHCQAFLKAIEPRVAAGEVAVRIIPVGFDTLSLRQSALMLSGGNGVERLIKYIKGDTASLTPSESLDTKAVDANTQILSQWNLPITPLIIYRAGKTQEVKLVRGQPADLGAAIADLRGQ
jgi:hypothetical protein